MRGGRQATKGEDMRRVKCFEGSFDSANEISCDLT